MAEYDDNGLSTVRTPTPRSERARATLPCLTIVAHPDGARLGQRAVLKALLVGQTVAVCRTEPSFGEPAGAPLAALDDAHVSRKPVSLSAADGGAIAISATSVESVRVLGEPLTGERVVSRADVERGVLIELGARVALVLHLSSNRPLVAAPGLLGQSDAIDQVRREIAKVGDLDTPVLILGATGTGKELVARAIHAASQRRACEFVAVNMAAIPETTASSVLFGHARGAFSGAQQRHQGLFERASAGTLLLDELGETPASVQPMLLRAIETGRILPLGDDGERSVDVRLLAATDANLEQELREDSFSAALLHRLAGYEIRLPPLCERGEDIPLLFSHFLREELEAVGEQDKRAAFEELLLRSGLVARLLRHELPGNLRQLRNLARHLVIANRHADTLAVSPSVERLLLQVQPSLLPPTAAPASPTTQRPPPVAADAISDAQLLDALRANDFSPNRTAASLGIATGTLHDLMRRSPVVRRAADLGDDELRAAFETYGGDTRAMAAHLQVSERGLRIAMRQRNLTSD